jgi:hypothetical protein
MFRIDCTKKKRTEYIYHGQYYFSFVLHQLTKPVLKIFLATTKGVKYLRIFCVSLSSLERKQKQEGHHQTEQAHSFGQGEPKNGVAEQLLFQGWVASVTDDQ